MKQCEPILFSTLEEVDQKLNALIGGLDTAAICAKELGAHDLRNNPVYQHIRCLRETALNARASLDEAISIEIHQRIGRESA